MQSQHTLLCYHTNVTALYFIHDSLTSQYLCRRLRLRERLRLRRERLRLRLLRLRLRRRERLRDR